jgi:heme-degrading monooxygenase HmoA
MQSQIIGIYATALSNKSAISQTPSLHFRSAWHYAEPMVIFAKASIAVIFIAQRTALDDESYAAAATAMVALAEGQVGYLGMDSVRGTDGLGITVSYWASDANAKAWRDHPDHKAIRDAGRDRWYSSYSLHVAEVTRSYDWQKS